MYINNFLLAANTLDTLQTLKDMLAKKYKIKDLNKVKTIIGQQITRNTVTYTIKIN